MRHRILLRGILTIGFSLAAVSFGVSQDRPAGPPPVDDGQPPAEQPVRRPNLFRALGLSPEQMQQIRKINLDRRPEMEAAVRRMRTANRELDLAIYADNVDEAGFQARLKEFQLAQAEVARLRFLSELQIRRILTPEQLVRFRELRARFGQRPGGSLDDRRPVVDGRRARPGMQRPDRPPPTPADEP
ncbi:MAG: Spy/CpxP family protein refolding chaperone [Pyrinomonadaceae bacterium]